MELRNVGLLDKIVNDFLRPYGCTAKFGLDFCYWTADEEIEYAVVVPEEDNRLFQNFIDNIFNPDVKLPTFVWSILHELGHHMTMDEISAEGFAYSEFIKRSIELDENGDKEKNFTIYASLPDEYAATKWAVEYANANFERVKKFWEDFREELMRFYEVNDIKED